MICTTPGVTVSILIVLRHNYINGVSIFQFFFYFGVSILFYFQLSINSILFFHIIKGYLSNFIIFI